MTYPAPTAQDLEAINAILARVTLGRKNIPSFGKDFKEACDLSKRLTGWRPEGPCHSCLLALFDRLRKLAGMTFARKPLTEDRVLARKVICQTCPAYHPHTDSCGRLILDAISPKPIEVNGHYINPCGCVISLKSMFKSETCPAGQWPK